MGPSVITIERFLNGPRAWGLLWFGLLCRMWLWLFRVCGGFVCPFLLVRAQRRFWSTRVVVVSCWFAFGVGFGPSRLALVLGNIVRAIAEAHGQRGFDN